MNCNDAGKLIEPSLDGELDGRTELVLAEHLEGCVGCREIRQQQGEARALRRAATYHRAPEGLRSQILAALPPEPIVTVARSPALAFGRGFLWWLLNGGGLVAALCALVVLAVVLPTGPSREAQIADQLIASHARALLTRHVIDVASSDQHTVKPWFDDKLDFSPPVRDLGDQGFQLVGGRVDYVDHRLVAVLVYQRRQHLIDVFVWPAGSGGEAIAMPEAQGYRVIGKEAHGMVFRAVSDLSHDELQELVSRL